MARNKINLNRFRKIYPRLRKSPVYWYKHDFITIETHVAAATAGQLSYQTVQTYAAAPIVVATAEQNVNVWVSGLTAVGDGTWAVTVNASDSAYAGDIHLHIGEDNG